MYAWLMPASTVVQAVIGGITVLTGLLWWTVAIHLLASMTMVWLAVLLYVKIGEPDDRRATLVVPKAVALVDRSERGRTGGASWSAGTLVTGAGPHAGDKSADRVGAAAAGRDHHAGARALVAADRLSRAARRPGLRVAGRPRAAAGAAAARRAARVWCARRASSGRCSSSPACPRRWSRCTSRARPRARRPPRRYGRRCESGPSPSRSRADSTAERELAAAAGRASSRRAGASPATARPAPARAAADRRGRR